MTVSSQPIKLTHECCQLPPLFQLLDCVIFHFHPFILNSLTYTALIFPVKCRAYEPNSPTLLTFTCNYGHCSRSYRLMAKRLLVQNRIDPTHFPRINFKTFFLFEWLTHRPPRLLCRRCLFFDVPIHLSAREVYRYRSSVAYASTLGEQQSSVAVCRQRNAPFVLTCFLDKSITGTI